MDPVFLLATAVANALSTPGEDASSAHWEPQAPRNEDVGSLALPRTVTLQLSGALYGRLFLCPDASASRHLFPELDDHAPELGTSWHQLIAGAADHLSKLIDEQFGPVQAAMQQHGERPSDALLIQELAFEKNGSSLGRLFLFTDPTLRTSLAQAAPAGSGKLALTKADEAERAPLDRVLDVPLTVKLRFGQRQLTLRELLELNTGSLVELDQQVEEPVSLVLGDRVIARGEVVIVDGNYGMRVLEVVESTSARSSAKV